MTADEIRPVDIASALDNIATGLDELSALLQIYDEHRDNELTGVDPNKPYTVAALVSRQELGLALLRAIEDKTIRLWKLSMTTMEKAYKLAAGEKVPTTESEG